MRKVVTSRDEARHQTTNSRPATTIGTMLTGPVNDQIDGARHRQHRDDRSRADGRGGQQPCGQPTPAQREQLETTWIDGLVERRRHDRYHQPAQAHQ